MCCTPSFRPSERVDQEFAVAKHAFVASNSAWIGHLPYRLVCTAETQAYRNMVIACDQFRRAKPGERDDQTDWNWVTHHLNPYREWIGAYIRTDSFAYACPGNMELAAEFAWRDTRMTHAKNGIYGEMFMAAMIAAAFVYDDPMSIVQAGLA